MAKWKVTYRSGNSENETIEATSYRDLGVDGRWIVFYRGSSQTGDAVPILQVRAEDVERIEEVREKG